MTGQRLAILSRVFAGVFSLAIAMAAAMPVAFAGAPPDFEAMEIREEDYVANPAGETITIYFDLFTHKDELAHVAPDARPAIAKTLARRVVEHYLTSLTQAERAEIKSATVALVFIPKRNEYNLPDMASLQQLALATVPTANGKVTGDVAITGSLAF